MLKNINIWGLIDKTNMNTDGCNRNILLTVFTLYLDVSAYVCVCVLVHLA